MTLDSMEAVEAFIENHTKGMLLCTTHTCNVCLSIDARFEKDKAIYEDWPIAKVHIDDLAAFRGSHSVFTVPTVLMFFEQKEIFRTSRFIEFDRLAYFVDVLKDQA